MTKFYKFRQNNSGGKFIVDPERGISVEVWIEADSTQHANTIAERVGLYFDGAGDCPCCGDRWYLASDYDASETAPEYVLATIQWAAREIKAPEGTFVAEGFVHYLDGRLVPLPFARMK